MKLPSDSRSKRSVAFLVALLWMFALAAGVANACLLEARSTHLYADSIKVAGDAPAFGPTHVLALTAGNHDQSEHSKEPCQKFCDDESRLLIKLNHGVDQPDMGPAPLVAVLWTLAEAASLEPLRQDDMHSAVPMVPLRLRYARLAL